MINQSHVLQCRSSLAPVSWSSQKKVVNILVLILTSDFYKILNNLNGNACNVISMFVEVKILPFESRIFLAK